MTELVVISGKGGTGKTSLVASFAALARDAVVADCDVDAADLHLVLEPTVERREDFVSGREAVIAADRCIGCGACLAHCRFGAVKHEGRPNGEKRFTIDTVSCEGCGVCVRFCPVKAIDFPDRRCGEWYISSTRHGPMVHARLGIAAENSGRLVSLVRREARRIATEQKRPAIIVDGPPGIGCPVIASISGCSLVLVVTEPTPSGAHDLARVVQLADHFKTPLAVCINKFDINREMSREVTQWVERQGHAVLATLPYDRAVTEAQVARQSIVEHDKGPLAMKVKELWQRLEKELEKLK